METAIVMTKVEVPVSTTQKCAKCPAMIDLKYRVCIECYHKEVVRRQPKCSFTIKERLRAQGKDTEKNIL